MRTATDEDIDRLVDWHLDPEVARFWDDETYTREEMVAAFGETDVDRYIVEADGVPVGYLQAWFTDDLPGEAGLDMFLIPDARGHGLGPDAARTIADWLLSAGGRGRVTVDPYGSNERAIRAWTKAGFRPVEEREPDDEHPQDWLLMTWERDQAAPDPSGGR